MLGNASSKGIQKSGGKNAQHKNQKARESVKEKWNEAKARLEQAKRDGMPAKERR